MLHHLRTAVPLLTLLLFTSFTTVIGVNTNNAIETVVDRLSEQAHDVYPQIRASASSLATLVLT